MKLIFRTALIPMIALLIGVVSLAQTQKNNSFTKSEKGKQMDTIVKQIFIDKFLCLKSCTGI
jgi:hypothetical protein